MPRMPCSRPRAIRRFAAALLVCVVVPTTGCGRESSSADPAPAAPAPAPVDPARRSTPRPDDAVAVAGDAVELRLTVPVGTAPDGSEQAVEIRSVEAGGRRHVVIDTPDGLIDQHVVTEDEHWWWIPPMAREAIGEVEWIHIDLAEVEAVDGVLPDVVADARTPLPAPGEIPVGTPVAGREVLAVERVGPDEDRLTLSGLDEPAVLRRRPLPAGTVIEPPAGAVELGDLPEAVHPELVPR